MTELEVTQLFDDKIALGKPSSLMLRGACGAFADWIARNWDRLSHDDRVELIAIGAVFLRVTIRMTRGRDDYH